MLVLMVNDLLLELGINDHLSIFGLKNLLTKMPFMFFYKNNYFLKDNINIRNRERYFCLLGLLEVF